ncbi:7tm 6 domain containing protein, partial [Asbolus verrucosus]
HSFKHQNQVGSVTLHKIMKGIIKQSFSINLRLMGAFGLYPPETSGFLYKVQAYFLYSAFTLPIPILGTLYFILDEEINAALDGNAFLIVEMACQITKLFTFIRNGDKIRKCIHYFEKPFFANYTDKQKKIIDRCSRICRRNSIIFLVSIIGGNIFWATRPFFSKEQKFPVDVWFPYNPMAGTKIFYSVYLFLVMGNGYSSMACAAVDPLIGGLACLAAGQLEVLKDNLQHLNEYAGKESEKLSRTGFCGKIKKSRIIYSKIHDCIDHHNAILKFVNNYEECFSSAVFSQFLGSTLVICFCCLQLSKVQPMSYNFFSMISFLSVFLAQIYIYCYYGTVLFEESNTLTNAIYMGRWYEYDVKSRKALVILMERSKKPILITAGTILDVSVGTFTM